MENKEILELVKSNARLSTNMESVQKDLNRLINLIEKDVKEDIEELDERIDKLEKAKEKMTGIFISISFIWSILYGVLIKFGATWFS